MAVGVAVGAAVGLLDRTVVGLGGRRVVGLGDGRVVGLDEGTGVAEGADPGKLTGFVWVTTGLGLTVVLAAEQPAAMMIKKIPIKTRPVIFFMCLSSLILTRMIELTPIRF